MREQDGSGNCCGSWWYLKNSNAIVLPFVLVKAKLILIGAILVVAAAGGKADAPAPGDHLAAHLVVFAGAQSHVRVSFDIPEYTAEITALGTVRLLEAIRDTGIDTRFYQASSSEMYGKVVEVPQTEETPFYPRSPYACAKVYSYWITKNYRESYGMYACNGILFNHESPRRGPTFVTRKITRAVARIKAGLQKKLYLGNLDAKRDWGYAPDYVEAMWMMLQGEAPEDFVIATGETHSVREFLEESFKLVGLDPWEFVEIDPKYFRPAEVDLLIGDATRAKEKLGWVPKVKFKELVKIMVEADIETLERQLSGKIPTEAEH